LTAVTCIFGVDLAVSC